MNDHPHTLSEQLEALLKKRRQESLAHDQEDIDLALGGDSAEGDQPTPRATSEAA